MAGKSAKKISAEIFHLQDDRLDIIQAMFELHKKAVSISDLETPVKDPKKYFASCKEEIKDHFEALRDLHERYIDIARLYAEEIQSTRVIPDGGDVIAFAFRDSQSWYDDSVESYMAKVFKKHDDPSKEYLDKIIAKGRRYMEDCVVQQELDHAPKADSDYFFKEFLCAMLTAPRISISDANALSLLQKGVKNILTLMGYEHWLVSMMELSVERANDRYFEYLAHLAEAEYSKTQGPGPSKNKVSALTRRLSKAPQPSKERHHSTRNMPEPRHRDERSMSRPGDRPQDNRPKEKMLEYGPSEEMMATARYRGDHRFGGQHMSKDGDQHMSKDGDQHMSKDGDQYDMSRDGDQHMSKDGDQHMSKDGDQYMSRDGDQHMSRDGDQYIKEETMAMAGLIVSKRQTSDGLSDIAPARKLQRQNSQRQDSFQRQNSQRQDSQRQDSFQHQNSQRQDSFQRQNSQRQDSQRQDSFQRQNSQRQDSFQRQNSQRQDSQRQDSFQRQNSQRQDSFQRQNSQRQNTFQRQETPDPDEARRLARRGRPARRG
jgi:hypothetical protein